MHWFEACKSFFDFWCFTFCIKNLPNKIFFIGIIIIKAAIDIIRELKNIQQGEKVNFEKYKLGIWKFLNRYQVNMLKNWILYQVLMANDTWEALVSSFSELFEPLVIRTSSGEEKAFHYKFTQQDLEINLNELIQEDLLKRENPQLFSLTEKGFIKVKKIIKRYSHHY